jgi:uncharacterized protein YbaR (Trm112 family)
MIIYMSNSILNYVICPECRSDKLLSKTKFIKCTNCLTNYPVKDNILILIGKNKQKEIELSWNNTGEYEEMHLTREYFDKRKEATSPQVSKLVSKFTNNKSISLNVGSGSGQYLKDIKGTIVSFDIIPYFIKETYKKLSSDKRFFLIADANEFPFKDNMFDLVFASQVIEHFDTKSSNKLIKKMMNSSKKTVLLDTPNDGNTLIRLVRKIVFGGGHSHQEDERLIHHRLMGVNDLKRLGFETHGFIGFVTRRKFRIKFVWDLYDFFAWFFPAIGGNLIGIYIKR